MCRLPFGDLELCGGWGDWRAASHQTKKGFDVHIWRSIANCCLKQQNVCHGTISWDSLNAYISRPPTIHCHLHLTKLLIRMSSNFGQLKASLKPKCPSFARSQCWCPYLVLDQRCSKTWDVIGEHFWQQDVSICKIMNLGGESTF